MKKILDPDSLSWSFLNNHTHILVVLASDPVARVRDLSEQVGITQRAVHRILAELEQEGFLKIAKQGRRNSYTINRRKRLRHPLESQHTIGELLDLLA